MKRLLIISSLLLSLNMLAQEKPSDSVTAEQLKQLLVGYWSPNEAELLKSIRLSAKEALNSGKVTDEELQKQARKYASMMVMQYTKSRLH